MGPAVLSPSGGEMTQHWENLGQVPEHWRRIRGIPLTLEQARQVFLEKALELGTEARGHTNPSPGAAKAAFLEAHVQERGRWVLRPGAEW